MNTKQPFISRGQIIADRAQFIGRQTLIAKLAKSAIAIEHHSNQVVSGCRSVGTTSLLYQVFNQENMQTQQHLHVIHANVSTFKTSASLFAKLAYQLGRKIVDLALSIELKSISELNSLDSVELSYVLEDYLTLLCTAKIKVIYVLDEFDEITRIFHQEPAYYQMLRELAYIPGRRLSLIVNCRKNIYDIESQAGIPEASTLCGIFQDVFYVKPFDQVELTDYLSQFKMLNVCLATKDNEKIHKYCGGIPYLLDNLCYQITQSDEQSKLVNVDAAFEQVKDKFITHAKLIRSDLISENLFDSFIIACKLDTKDRSIPARKLKTDILYLEKLGLLQANGVNYIAYSVFFSDFVKADLSEYVTVTDLIIEVESLLKELFYWINPIESSSLKRWHLRGLSDNGSSDVLKTIVEKCLKVITYHTEIEYEQLLNDLNELATIDVKQTDTLAVQNQTLTINTEKLITQLAKLRRIKNDLLVVAPVHKQVDDLNKSFSKKGCFIERLDLCHFKVFEALKFDLKKPVRWVFITGENGYGKTALLQGIAATLNRGKVEQTLREDFNCAYVINHQTTQHLFNYKNPLSPQQSFTHFLAYGSSRLIQTSRMGGDDDSTPISSLFDEQSAFLSIETFLLEQQKLFSESKESKEKAQYENRIIRTKEALLRLLENFYNDIDVEGTKIQYISKSSDKVLFQDLSAGHRSLIGMVGDMIVRILALQPDIECFSDFSGIILIDEIDVHLHPKLQKSLPKILSETFPHVQFIVSTHSPIPILGAPKDSAFRKVSCNDTGEFEVSDCKEELGDVEYTNPNVLFSSPVFDLENFFHCDSDDPEKNDVADSFRESQIDKGLKSKDAEENEKLNQILSVQ